MTCEIDKNADWNRKYETLGGINRVSTTMTVNMHYFCRRISVKTDLTANSVITK